MHGPLSSYLLLASENYHFWSADITLFMLSIFLSHYMVVLDLFVSSEKGIFLFFTFILFSFNILVLVVYYRRIGHGDLRWKRLCIYCTSVYLSKFHLALSYILKEQLFSESLVYLCCVVTDHEYITICWTKVFLWFVPRLGTILKYKMITLPNIFILKGQQERISSANITKNPLGGCNTRMPF